MCPRWRKCPGSLHKWTTTSRPGFRCFTFSHTFQYLLVHLFGGKSTRMYRTNVGVTGITLDYTITSTNKSWSHKFAVTHTWLLDILCTRFSLIIIVLFSNDRTLHLEWHWEKNTACHRQSIIGFCSFRSTGFIRGRFAISHESTILRIHINGMHASN